MESVFVTGVKKGDFEGIRIGDLVMLTLDAKAVWMDRTKNSSKGVTPIHQPSSRGYFIPEDGKPLG